MELRRRFILAEGDGIEAGDTLEVYDDHTLVVKRNGKIVTRLNNPATTKEFASGRMAHDKLSKDILREFGLPETPVNLTNAKRFVDRKSDATTALRELRRAAGVDEAGDKVEMQGDFHLRYQGKVWQDVEYVKSLLTDEQINTVVGRLFADDANVALDYDVDEIE